MKAFDSAECCCFPVQICSVSCPNLAQQHSVKLCIVLYLLLVFSDEALCWFTITPRSSGASLSSSMRRLCYTDSLLPPRCSTILNLLLTIICTTYIEIRPIIMVCLFWRCFRQYILIMIVTKASIQWKRTPRESQTDEETEVQEEGDCCTILVRDTLHWIHFVPNSIHWLATTQVANNGIFCPGASKPTLPG